MNFLGINFKRSYIRIVFWILLTLSTFQHTHAFFRSTFPFQQQHQRPPSTSCTAHREYYGGSEEDKNGFFSYAVKYEMTPLPDSLMDTTIFVGNLGDFVTEDTLSRLFATVSTLQTVPSAVARKPNNYSMGYGFVTFPTLEEKEQAIEMFHGYNLEGRAIKVERIKSHGPRVRVPERLLVYTLGEVKRTREGKPNTLRQIFATEKKAPARRARSPRTKGNGKKVKGVSVHNREQSQNLYE